MTNDIMMRAKLLNRSRHQSGFTIVELLIVIVVIAILAAITLVSYNGIQRRANETALRSDVSQAAKILALEGADTGTYPVNHQQANAGRGLPSNGATVWQYTSSGTSYCVTGTRNKNDISPFYVSSSNHVVQQGTCPGHATNPLAGAAGICSGLTLVASDSFEGSGALSAPWTGAAFTQASGSASLVSAGNALHDQAHRSGAVTSCASIKLGAVTNPGVGIVYRMGGPSFRAAIVASSVGATAQLQAGPLSQTNLLPGGGWSSGDIMTVGLSAGRVLVYQNGTLLYDAVEPWTMAGPTSLGIRFGMYSGGVGNAIDEFYIYSGA